MLPFYVVLHVCVLVESVLYVEPFMCVRTIYALNHLCVLEPFMC
jgi:hypothetical protein